MQGILIPESSAASQTTCFDLTELDTSTNPPTNRVPLCVLASLRENPLRIRRHLTELDTFTDHVSGHPKRLTPATRASLCALASLRGKPLLTRQHLTELDAFTAHVSGHPKRLTPANRTPLCVLASLRENPFLPRQHLTELDTSKTRPTQRCTNLRATPFTRSPRVTLIPWWEINPSCRVRRGLTPLPRPHHN